MSVEKSQKTGTAAIEIIRLGSKVCIPGQTHLRGLTPLYFYLHIWRLQINHRHGVNSYVLSRMVLTSCRKNVRANKVIHAVSKGTGLLALIAAGDFDHRATYLHMSEFMLYIAT
jgi:hypothetical protein